VRSILHNKTGQLTNGRCDNWGTGRMIDRESLRRSQSRVGGPEWGSEGCQNPKTGSRVIASSVVQDKELFKIIIEPLNLRFGHDSMNLAAQMNEQVCLPGVREPATPGDGPGFRSPTGVTGLPTLVRYSPSSPLLAGYNSRRWWRPSSTNVWCSAVDQTDFDRISRGRFFLLINAL